jgi:hypothetical protein
MLKQAKSEKMDVNAKRLRTAVDAKYLLKMLTNQDLIALQKFTHPVTRCL